MDNNHFVNLAFINDQNTSDTFSSNIITVTANTNQKHHIKDGQIVHVVPSTDDYQQYKYEGGILSPVCRQFLAASGIILFSIGSGMTSGFSAVLLPQLKSDNSTLKISEEEGSWIASMAALPMAVGCLAGGFIMERAGRKRTSLYISVPALLGWFLICIASDLKLLLAGRFLTGFAAGAFGPVGLVYIGETSSPIYRGALLAATALSIALGILFSHVFGAFLYWPLAAGLCSIAPICGTILIFLSPESPTWLARKGRKNEAEAIFCKLRGTENEAVEELKNILNQAHSHNVEPVSIGKHLIKPSFVKPFLFMNIFFTIQQFSGVNAVAFYTVQIFKETLSAGGSSVDEYLAMLIIDVVRVIMSVVACMLLRNFGRRPLALISAVGTAISLILLSIFIRFGSHLSSINILFSWLPILFLVSYICFVSIGLVPLPWVMTGEVFPVAVRGIGSGSTSCVGFLMFFTVVKTGPALFSSLGSHGAFLIYGLIATSGAVFLYFSCPETKNKTLQDIEDKFNENSKSKRVTAATSNI